MTGATTGVCLSRDDVHALCVAGSVSFHMQGGRAYIRAYLDGPDAVFTRRERTLFPRTDFDAAARGREIDCAGTVYADSDGDWVRDAECSHDAMRANAVWSTVATLLTVGDVLSLDWLAGVRADELRLNVHRGSGTLTFLIGYRVRADKRARMIRF